MKYKYLIRVSWGAQTYILLTVIKSKMGNFKGGGGEKSIIIFHGYQNGENKSPKHNCSFPVKFYCSGGGGGDVKPQSYSEGSLASEH